MCHFFVLPVMWTMYVSGAAAITGQLVSRRSLFISPMTFALPLANTDYRHRTLTVPWGGSMLPCLSPTDALSTYGAEHDTLFPMGRWPDPVLRQSTTTIPPSMYNSDALHHLARCIQNTSRNAGAVGLAAQQCGVKGSLVYLESNSQTRSSRRWLKSSNDECGEFLVNPRFVYRSPEEEMQVWDERCLVLPPDFCATVLRDRRVVVEAETLDGATLLHDLSGENARAVQHECQHDEGILIIDHVDLNDMSQTMRRVEETHHDERQRRAFQRTVVSSTVFH